MLDAVRQNTQLLDSIATACREQASSIDEVNIAVRTMDEMTQHNAALVEQINASIEKTEAQAGELDRIVDVFRTSRISVVFPTSAQVHASKVASRAPLPRHQNHRNAALKQEWSDF